MAMFQRKFTGDFDALLAKVEKIVMNGSISASMEERVDYKTAQGRCSVRVFERYVTKLPPDFRADSIDQCILN